MECPDVFVRIGGDERPICTADVQWVHQTIHAHQRAGRTPCVQVRIETSGVNVLLATHACPQGGGCRPPNRAESEVISMWSRFGLSDSQANLMRVWPFLQSLRSWLGLRAA